MAHRMPVPAEPIPREVIMARLQENITDAQNKLIQEFAPKLVQDVQDKLEDVLAKMEAARGVCAAADEAAAAGEPTVADTAARAHVLKELLWDDLRPWFNTGLVLYSERYPYPDLRPLASALGDELARHTGENDPLRGRRWEGLAAKDSYTVRYSPARQGSGKREEVTAHGFRAPWAAAGAIRLLRYVDTGHAELRGEPWATALEAAAYFKGSYRRELESVQEKILRLVSFGLKDP